MMKAVFTILVSFVPFVAAVSGGGFSGAGGFSFYLWKPDLGPINNELRSLGMPQFSQSMILYGGQGFAHVSDRMRIGGMGFGGSIRVKDMEDGYAREASFSMSWGGFLMEYIILEPGDFEIYGGATLGWGAVSVHLQKTSGPANWDDLLSNFAAEEGTTDNISSNLEHSFFLAQPRLGIRYYLLDWLAVSGSVDYGLIALSSGGWTQNGEDVYNAPSLDLIKPFFQFTILAGG